MNLEYLVKISKPMLEGAGTTVSLFLIAIALSVPLGFLFTLMSRSRIKVIAGFAHTYIYIMRGTPLTLQLLFFCFGLPMLPVIGEFLVMDRFVAACLGFVLNYAAYFARFSGAACFPSTRDSMRLHRCWG